MILSVHALLWVWYLLYTLYFETDTYCTRFTLSLILSVHALLWVWYLVYTLYFESDSYCTRFTLSLILTVHAVLWDHPVTLSHWISRLLSLSPMRPEQKESLNWTSVNPLAPVQSEWLKCWNEIDFTIRFKLNNDYLWFLFMCEMFPQRTRYY